MTLSTSAMRMHSDSDRLVVECLPCGLRLSQHPGFDRDVAVGTFLQHHPSSERAVHRPDVPAGWSLLPPELAA